MTSTGTMRFLLLLSLGLLAVASPATAQAQLDSALADRLATVAPTERVNFYLVMEEQPDTAGLRRDYPEALFTPKERRSLFSQAAREVADRTQAELLGWLQELPDTEARNLRPLWIINAVAGEATPAVIRTLTSFEGVERIMLTEMADALAFETGLYASVLQPPAPLVLANTWGIDKIRAPLVWANNITGKGVIVANADTGTCYTHPDLTNNVWRNTDEIPNNNVDDDNNGYVDDDKGWDFGGNDNDPMDDFFSWHGTHTSGTVVGDGTLGTQTGVAPDAKVMITKVLENGGGLGPEVWEAFQYALDNGAHLMTASIGWVSCVHTKHRGDWRTAADNASFAGLILVFAGGNERGFNSPPQSIRTPGDCPNVIGVGATDSGDSIAGFSSQGPTEWGPSFGGCHSDVPFADWENSAGGLSKPDVSAPGVGVDSTTSCSTYSGPTYSGTSMATPHVSGVIALMLEANPLLTRDDILDIFATTSVDLGAPGKDRDFGWGRIDAFDAVTAAANLKAVEVDLISTSTVLNPGDTVSFDATITNTTGSPQTVDLWADLTRPNGGVLLSPFVGPKTVTVNAGATINVSLSRATPAGKANGTMVVTLKAGSFGVSVDDADSVAITFR